MGISWLIDTVVPCGPLKISTRALSCFARASTMLVPKPLLTRPFFRKPTPLSDTDRRQLAPSTSYLTNILPPPLGNAYFSALITSSVTISPILITSSGRAVPAPTSTCSEVGRLSLINDVARVSHKPRQMGLEFDWFDVSRGLEVPPQGR